MIQKTPLHGIHLASGAKMVPFSGWEMPLSYVGVPEEHRAVRTAVGLFDISHMGRFELAGVGAEAALDFITPGPLGNLKPGGAQYSMLLNEAGGIIDDIYIYKRGADRFFIIVNAANRAKDFAWMSSHLAAGPSLTDISEQTALIACQGPRSWEVLAQILPPGMAEIPLRQFIETQIAPVRGASVLVARTGYTGEKGYELVVPADAAGAVWRALSDAGKVAGIQPIGLGARDTLRLEMGYLLYGHDMTETTSPVAADLSRFIDFDKAFLGKAAVDRAPSARLIGFTLSEGGIPREGCTIHADGKQIGVVTSGNFSPMLRRGIGMGYIEAGHVDIGRTIAIDIRGRAVAAALAHRPFYSKKK